MMVEFEREQGWQTREPTTEVRATVIIEDDGEFGLTLTSDEVEGDRQWRIIEFTMGIHLYDVRESSAFGSAGRFVEPLLPEGPVLDAVRKAFGAWVAAEKDSAGRS